MKIAVIAPEQSSQASAFAEKLESKLSESFKLIDRSLSETAFHAVNSENFYNLSLERAKNTGAAIGCDYFTLIKSEQLRRYSLEKKEYYESYAAVYAVSARSGRVVYWKLVKGEAAEPEKADDRLYDSAISTAAEISERLQKVRVIESKDQPPANIESVPVGGSPASANYRPPLPYKRISPKYTSLAALYGITATVDIEVDFDEKGQIRRSEIMRWAGYGLDESVKEAVHSMNWRAADRNGKALPMRVLLRYNFKKIEPREEEEQ